MAVSTVITPAYRLEALAFDLYQGFFGAFPVETASRMGAGLLRAIGPLLGAPQKTAMRNLRMCFPDESELWRREIARASWAEVGRTAAELSHLHELAAPSERLVIEGMEHFDAVRGTGAVLISGHFANWEMLCVGIVQSRLDCVFTYRPANNPLIDQRIVDTRTRYGIKLQAAKGVQGGVGLMRALKRGRSVALMNDQKYNEGVASPLFGYACMTADGPTRLALAHRVPLIPVGLRREGGARFRMTIHPPLPLDYDAAPETEIPASVGRINAFLEARIREAPEQWFWVHQRWPKEAWAKAGVL
ncbi:MAG: lysophospholipid acyltransferase family protein [Hyphomonadaceae bacterium]